MTGTTSSNRTIAFVSNSAWSVYNFRLDVIRYLISQHLHIIVLASDDAYSAKLVEEGCRFIPLHFNNRSENPVLDYFFYRQLRRQYRILRPKFIFHYVAKPNIYGSLAAQAEKIPSVAVITGLGYPFAKRNLLFTIIRQLYRVALRHAKEVWFLNNEDARVFIAEKITPINKMKVLPGEGVNPFHFAPVYRERTSDSFNFLMSTRLLRSKGVELYADAARILRKKNYKVNFALIGFFEDQHPDSIPHADLGKWQQEGLIEYKGFADDVRSFLGEADCFVFPSFYNEGVPRCLMEAASMELPIITTMNRGCKEVVLNNSNGFICNTHDAFDLADKMEKMINLTPEERSRMGKNGRQLIMKKFDVRKVIQEYANTLILPFEVNHGSNSQHSSTT